MPRHPLVVTQRGLIETSGEMSMKDYGLDAHIDPSALELHSLFVCLRSARIVHHLHILKRRKSARVSMLYPSLKIVYKNQQQEQHPTISHMIPESRIPWSDEP